jgi:DNA mismatch repair protein MutL
MGRIARLPEDVSNQIAAGEVVERPASAVKELVENALDAGARRIVVAIELGGKRRIRVEDDGEGMSPEDARLSVERHATSKIRRADDLVHVSTLGFRGEALPSIASVSRFRLRTRTQDVAEATEVRVDGGAAPVVRAAAGPEGTLVEVDDLFYNQQARRKFLKSDAAETAQTSKVLTQLALGHPGVGFTLTSGPRTLIECPPVTTLRERLYQIYGDRTELVEVRREGGPVTVLGFVAALTVDGARRGPQNVFVNGRVVKDRTIAHAILDAYRAASIQERSPEVHLFLDVPRDGVDVNVHPAKAEVRFRESSHIHQVVRRAVADALGGGRAPVLRVEAPGVAASGAGIHAPRALPGAAPAVFPRRWSTPGARPYDGLLARDVAAEGGPGAEAVGGAPSADVTRPLASGTLGADAGFETALVPLGQFRDTFIIAVDEQGVLLIDQHVAHERILFERISERLTGGRVESQRLLHPLLLSLDAAARQALLAHADDLERLGFEVGDFGGDALHVAAMPALLDAAACEGALRALAEDLEGLDRGAAVTDALQNLAATMACHAAVKANDPLSPEKINYILAELRRTAYSTICPHGRPVMLRLTRREIEKAFERI